MESLFSTFPPTSLSEWKERLIKDLKGTSFEDLGVEDDNGLKIFPFYNLENAAVNGKCTFRDADWEICSNIKSGNIKTANQKALFALNNGASGLIFRLEDNMEVNVEALLDKISIEHIYTSFVVKKNVQNCLNHLQALLAQRDLSNDTINCNIDFDPVSHYLISGNEIDYQPPDYANFIHSSRSLKNVTVNASLYQNAGLNSVSQLALALSHLNEYFHCLEKHNALNDIRRVDIKVATGTCFFEEIAKLRAARILFKNLFKAYGLETRLFIACQTSDIYRSYADMYNNILRDSISGMAAVIGGCDALLIHSFDEGSSTDSTRFSERIARNQQLIFKEESYLNKVADISSGSYYLETLTTNLAEKAWAYFQQIENGGGFLEYFKSGQLKKEVDIQSQQLIQDYKEGRRVLIGVNKHLNQSEKTSSHYPATRHHKGERISTINIARALQE